MAEPPRRRLSPAPWPDIPAELAGLVLLRLRAHVDRVRFAAVCRNWRAAARLAPLPPPLPLLLLRDGTAHGLPDGEQFRLPRRCADYTDASGDWLVFVHGDSCFLRNAFSDATVTLPALSRVRARHVNRVMGHVWLEIDGAKELTVHKVLYCLPHLIAALVSVFQKKLTRIAVCQPGAKSWWSVLVDHRSPRFIDMVFYRGQLYAFDEYQSGLFAIGIIVNQITGDPWVSEIRWAIDPVLNGPSTFVHRTAITMQSIYLVESCGELLMVCRTMHGRWKPMPMHTESGKRTVVAAERNEFEVFKADFEEMQWTKVTTIGDDNVLFLRGRCSRSVCVSEHEMHGDSIIFMQNDDEDRAWYDENSLSSCSVYNMKDRNSPPFCRWYRGSAAQCL